MPYEIGALPLETLIGPAARAAEAIVRLDERIARSAVRDGWLSRQDFADAAETLWIEGELVHMEDLVLHDARMDVRMPTHELTRAHTILRTRRQILAHPAGWALSGAGLAELTGRGRLAQPIAAQGEASPETPITGDAEDGDELADQLTAIDALLVRTSRVLDGQAVPARQEQRAPERSELVYDLDWDEDARLDEWRAAVAAAQDLPAVFQAAIANDAWLVLDVLQRGAWLGPLLAGALMRERGLTTAHLANLQVGARHVPREKRRSRDRTQRLIAFFETVEAAALAGFKEHDRLVLAQRRMQRRLKGRRSSSRLPGLVDLVLARPLVSTNMVQDTLKVSRQGALDLVEDLGLREMTGRGRFKAWGIV